MELSYKTLYNSIMTSSTDGIAITDLEGRITNASNSVLKLFGLDEEKLIGFCYLEFITAEDRKRASEDMALRIQRKYLGKPACYHANRIYGGVFFLEVNAAPIMDSNTPTGLVIILRDVTDSKLQEEELAKTNRKLSILSITDSLTGIANRRYFEEMLKSEYSRHIRMGKELTVIIADIDYFKDYNDFYGHVEGDACLCQIAQVINEGIFRSCDLVARYGGEEFALILPDTDIKGAMLVAERIRNSVISLEIPHEKSSVASIVTVSFGAASSYCTVNKDAFSIVVEADKMLYQAKSEGRNRVITNQEKPSWKPEYTSNLKPIEWLKEYKSGDSIIDNEHQGMFRSINSLLEADLSHAKLTIHAENLLDEIAVHFHNEERLLYAVHYPDIGNHIKEHMKLLRIAKPLVSQYKEKHLSAKELFSFFAHELIEQHLLRADSLYFPYLSVRES